MEYLLSLESNRLGEFIRQYPEKHMGGWMYNMYKITIDKWNEQMRAIDPSHVDAIGFKEVKFIMRDPAYSNVNDNISYKKRLFDDYLMTIDMREVDKKVNALSLDVPWGQYVGGKTDTTCPVDSSTISVDVLETPNILDQDVVVEIPIPDNENTRRMRDIDEEDEEEEEDGYYPQEYKVIDGKVYRKVLGYNKVVVDLDVYCLRTLTVTPSAFPYTFSIADYNSGYNTNYVGIRNLVINGPESRVTVDKYDVKFYASSAVLIGQISNLPFKNLSSLSNCDIYTLSKPSEGSTFSSVTLEHTEDYMYLYIVIWKYKANNNELFSIRFFYERYTSSSSSLNKTFRNYTDDELYIIRLTYYYRDIVPSGALNSINYVNYNSNNNIIKESGLMGYANPIASFYFNGDGNVTSSFSIPSYQLLGENINYSIYDVSNYVNWNN